MKAIHEPVSFVGQAAVGVVEGALAMHLVVLPVARIIAAVLVVEYASAVPLRISNHSDILGPYIILNAPFLAFSFVGFEGMLLFVDLSYSRVLFVLYPLLLRSMFANFQPSRLSHLLPLRHLLFLP